MSYNSILSRALEGKELLIFDFDGTVANTSPLHAAAFAEVLSSLGVSVDYATIAGLTTTEAIRTCLVNAGRSASPDQIEHLACAKQAKARELISASVEPMPGMRDFLIWARQHYRLSIATSGSRGTVTLALATLGFAEWFDPLVCSEDVKRPKPDPEIFLRAMGSTGVSPDRTLIFEDSEPGFTAAHAAGIEYVDVHALFPSKTPSAISGPHACA